MGILVGTEKINSYTKKQESYILQGNGEHSAGRADDSNCGQWSSWRLGSWSLAVGRCWFLLLGSVTYSMCCNNAFSVFQISVRVTTMDAELEFAIQPNTTGKQLFDQVSDGAAEDLKLIWVLWFY